MNTLESVNPVGRASCSFPEKITLTFQQEATHKLALAIFAVAFIAVFLVIAERLRKRVKVEDTQGIVRFQNIDHVSGKVKVTYTSFWSSNATLEGTLTNGRLNGQGKIDYPTGSVAKEEGEFKDGYLHGQGFRTYRDGSKEGGIYEMGKLKNALVICQG